MNERAQLMFPALVGMNRTRLCVLAANRHVPRTRGDEPEDAENLIKEATMFPALVGMNRSRIWSVGMPIHVPRTRGDEPRTNIALTGAYSCSPHSWG